MAGKAQEEEWICRAASPVEVWVNAWLIEMVRTAVREKVLKNDSPAIALTLQQLGLVCYHLGRYADAEPLYKRALALQEKESPPNSRSSIPTARSANGFWKKKMYQDRRSWS